MERDLHLPAEYEPGNDLSGVGGEISAQKGLRRELSPRITEDDPANGRWRETRRIPDGGLRQELE